MNLSLKKEEVEVGKANFNEAVGYGWTRRDFLGGTLAAGGVATLGLGAAYFGYRKSDMAAKGPVRVGIIGTGDEGNVLIGGLNPDFMEVKAICDIRPFNVHRALHGDWASGNTIKHRPGLINVYGYADETAARKKIKVYEDYKDVLADPEIEAIIIALPLHLHAQVAIQAMQAGKHVLTEKLMARTVGQCKDMCRVARSTGKLLATGHQRHYSVLYDNAKRMIQWGLLGQIHYIQAQWHRGNLPGNDSWKPPLPGGELRYRQQPDGSYALQHVDIIKEQIAKLKAAARGGNPTAKKKYEQWVAWDMDRTIADMLPKYGYKGISSKSFGRDVPPLEELIRWRLFDHTGGGLMAELGSHQMDAASIFISALRDSQGGKKSEKVHPLKIHAVGGRHIFPKDRHADDHVYCIVEFPGPHYDYDFRVGYQYGDVTGMLPDPREGIQGYNENPERKIVVTYSSIMGSGFGGYGEVVMGTKADLVMARERDAMLYKRADTGTKVKVKEKGGAPVLDTTESGAPTPAAAAAATMPVSRGYQEELEHFAWCLRQGQTFEQNDLHCGPEVALGDAVIALTAKVAIDQNNAGRGGHITFNPDWFDMNSDSTSDGSKPMYTPTGGKTPALAKLSQK